MRRCERWCGGEREKDARRDEMEQISDELPPVLSTHGTDRIPRLFVGLFHRTSLITNESERQGTTAPSAELSSRSVEYYTRNKVLGPFLGAMPVERCLK